MKRERRERCRNVRGTFPRTCVGASGSATADSARSSEGRAAAPNTGFSSFTMSCHMPTAVRARWRISSYAVVRITAMRMAGGTERCSRGSLGLARGVTQAPQRSRNQLGPDRVGTSRVISPEAVATCRETRRAAKSFGDADGQNRSRSSWRSFRDAIGATTTRPSFAHRHARPCRTRDGSCRSPISTYRHHLRERRRESDNLSHSSC